MVSSFPSANESAGPRGGRDLALAVVLFRHINGYWISQSLAVAAELRIPDLLASGLRSVDELATAAGCHGPSLRRLLRGLASLGLFEERADGTFVSSPLGTLLEQDGEYSLRATAIWNGQHQWPAWGNLRRSVMTGERASMQTMDFQNLDRYPQEAAIFHQAMTEITRIIAREIVSVYDFSQFKRVVDVGSGHGEMLISILRAFPTVRGELFDLPSAIAGARTRLEHAGLTARCALISGDFFESVPSGADCYLLKRVIHDWDDEQANKILSSCQTAMPPNAKLLLVEQVMPERIEPSTRNQDLARIDLNMLVMLGGGRERTTNEYHDLLQSAGFRVIRVVHAAFDFHLIEAVRR